MHPTFFYSLSSQTILLVNAKVLHSNRLRMSSSNYCFYHCKFTYSRWELHLAICVCTPCTTLGLHYGVLTLKGSIKNAILSSWNHWNTAGLQIWHLTAKFKFPASSQVVINDQRCRISILLGGSMSFQKLLLPFATKLKIVNFCRLFNASNLRRLFK